MTSLSRSVHYPVHLQLSLMHSHKWSKARVLPRGAPTSSSNLAFSANLLSAVSYFPGSVLEWPVLYSKKSKGLFLCLKLARNDLTSPSAGAEGHKTRPERQCEKPNSAAEQCDQCSWQACPRDRPAGDSCQSPGPSHAGLAAIRDFCRANTPAE